MSAEGGEVSGVSVNRRAHAVYFLRVPMMHSGAYLITTSGL